MLRCCLQVKKEGENLGILWRRNAGRGGTGATVLIFFPLAYLIVGIDRAEDIINDKNARS